MDGQVGYGLQGADVSLLPLRLGGVASAVGDQGGEVPYPAYVMTGKQGPRQPPNIEPTVRRTPKRTIVEIKTVDIDVGTDECRPKKS